MTVKELKNLLSHSGDNAEVVFYSYYKVEGTDGSWKIVAFPYCVDVKQDGTTIICAECLGIENKTKNNKQ